MTGRVTPYLEDIILRMTERKLRHQHVTVGLDDYEYLLRKYGEPSIFGIPLVANRRFREGWIAVSGSDVTS